MNDLVSVIIPTYNRSQFVIEAIDSVLDQTYPNIELIVVNDGSTDDTEEKLQPYMDRITTYVKQENGGISSAVNAGLRAAKGKYITRLDDDDLFAPDKVEKQVRFFEKNPDVGLVTSGCFITDSVGRTISVREAPDFSEYGPFITLLLQYPIFQLTVMVRRECHDKVGFYRDVLGEDFDMFLRISRHYRFGVVDQPLGAYRRHLSNITYKISENEVFQEDMKTFIRDIMDDVPLTEIFPAIDGVSDAYRTSCAYSARGALYLGRRIYDRADADFHKALDLCPTSSISNLWLGISARYQEDFQSAEKCLSRIQESDSLYPIAQNARDLFTAIQKSRDADSDLLKREISKERMKLFKITFDGISGKSTDEKLSARESASMRLRFSRYNVIVDDYPQVGKHLIFNTFTHAMVNIDDELKDLIHDPDRPVSRGSLENLRMLRKMGIVVNRGSDETGIIRKWYDSFKQNTSRMSVTILTTLDCNFACGYCIEEGVKKPVYMSDECSNSLVEWLMDRVEKEKTEELSVLFYGGEPLLNAGPIYSISEKLQKFAVDKGILFRSSITTNGSLIDGQLLQDLARHGLRAVKITIDGDRRTHNSRRPFKDGRGSFDIIMENIQEIPETVKLAIQANLDEDNIDGFPYLLDIFERSGLKDRTDSLVVSPIVQSLGSTSMSAVQEMECTKLSDSPIADELIYMRKLVVEREFKSKYDDIGYVGCSMNKDGATFVVDPNGTLFTCPAFVGRGESFSIGNIYHSQINPVEKIPEARMEGCLQCTFFPVCGGGCRYRAYLLYGDYTKISCEGRYIEHRTKEMIRLIYDQKVKMHEQKVKQKTVA